MDSPAINYLLEWNIHILPCLENNRILLALWYYYANKIIIEIYVDGVFYYRILNMV